MLLTFKKYKNTISSIFLLMFSIGYFYSATTIKTLSQEVINSQFLPKIIAIALALLSISEIISSLKSQKSSQITQSEDEIEVQNTLNKSSIISVVSTLIFLSIYIVLLKPIGFLISTIGYTFIQIMILTPIDKRNILFSIILSVASSAIIYFIFVYVLNLMLPKGILNF